MVAVETLQKGLDFSGLAKVLALKHYPEISKMDLSCTYGLSEEIGLHSCVTRPYDSKRIVILGNLPPSFLSYSKFGLSIKGIIGHELSHVVLGHLDLLPLESDKIDKIKEKMVDLETIKRGLTEEVYEARLFCEQRYRLEKSLPERVMQWALLGNRHYKSSELRKIINDNTLEQHYSKLS